MLGGVVSILLRVGWSEIVVGRNIVGGLVGIIVLLTFFSSRVAGF